MCDFNIKAREIFDKLPHNLWNKKFDPHVRLTPDWDFQPEWIKQIFISKVKLERNS